MYLFFVLSSQQFDDALNSLISNFFINSKNFSVSMIPSFGIFWLLFSKNPWKTALCICPQRLLFREEDIPFFSKETVNLWLFFTHVEKVFFGTLYIAVTSLFVIPFSKSLKSLHFIPADLLLNLRFIHTIALSQRAKNVLFQFTTLFLSFQKSNALFEKVGMFKF